VLSTAPESFTISYSVNPVTGREWNAGELGQFGVTSTDGTQARFGWRIQAVQRGVPNILLYGRPANDRDRREYGAIESVGGAIYAVDFRAKVVDETRVAYGYRADDRKQKPGWNKWVVESTDFTTSEPWEKKAGVEYLFHQTVEEAAFGGGAVARGLDVRVLSSETGGARVPVRERVPKFLGGVPVSAGEVKPWAPAAVLEVET
jgi:hypothetical protein